MIIAEFIRENGYTSIHVVSELTRIIIKESVSQILHKCINMCNI